MARAGKGRTIDSLARKTSFGQPGSSPMREIFSWEAALFLRRLRYEEICRAWTPMLHIEMCDYGSYQNCILVCTCAATALPFFRAGSYTYCFMSSTAVFRNLSGPESTVTDFT